MATGHRHHAPGQPIDRARERELETLLANPQFEAAVRAYDREDCDHDIPDVGGSGTDWRTIFWDRHLCVAIQAGQFRIGGRPVDPRRTGKVHEATEGAIIHLWPLVMQLLGWPDKPDKYTPAHDVADVAEHHAVNHLGWNWDEYQAAWKPFIRTEEHESITDPPPDLLLEPYKGTPLYAKLAAAQSGGGIQRIPAAMGEGGSQGVSGIGKLTHAQAGYHSGPGKTGSHCATCKHFLVSAPPDCDLVEQPIRPNDGCNYWTPRQGKATVRRKNAKPRFDPRTIGARQAPDGHHYVADKRRPGKFLRVIVHG